jgi:hypothetical protein
LFGIVLVIGSFLLLTWNEGRSVEAIRALDQAARQVVEVDAAAIDPQAEGKLVHLTGLMETSAPAHDPIFGVGGDGLLRLSRKVSATTVSSPTAGEPRTSPERVSCSTSRLHRTRPVTPTAPAVVSRRHSPDPVVHFSSREGPVCEQEELGGVP